MYYKQKIKTCFFFFVLELQMRWKKEPIVYHYRRFAVTKYAIANVHEVTTHPLFPGRHPTRVFLAVVEAKKTAGTQESSPFEFYRSWEYPAKVDLSQRAEPMNEERLSHVESLLHDILLQGETSRGKGKRIQPNRSFLQRARRLLNKDLDDGASTSSHHSSRHSRERQLPEEDPEYLPLRPSTVRNGETKTVYLKKCQLKIDEQELGKKKISPCKFKNLNF